MNIDEIQAGMSEMPLPTEVDLTHAARFVINSAADDDVSVEQAQYATVLLAWMCGHDSEDLESCGLFVANLAMQAENVIAKVQQ